MEQLTKLNKVCRLISGIVPMLFSDFDNCIKLTLEQHRFKLCRSTNMQIFFIKYTVGLLYPRVSHLQIQPTAD